MIFLSSLSLTTFSTILPRLSLSHFVSTSQYPLTLFSLAAFSFKHSNCHKPSLFSPHGQKKVALHLCILYMSDLLVSASRNSVSFDFFAINEICSILCKNHISVVSSSSCNCFEIVQALHPYIGRGSI